MPGILFRDKDGTVQSSFGAADLPGLLAAAEGLLWVDLTDERELGEAERLLTQVFKFHPLAVDDALNEIHVPKVDDWGEYLYIVLQEVEYAADRSELVMHELDVFLGHHYLVTYHHEPIRTLERLWQQCQADGRPMERSAAYLLYRLIDELAAEYAIKVDEVEATLDGLEERLFTQPGRRTPEALFDLKRIVLQLRRIAADHRDVLSGLAREGYPVIPEPARPYFRDIYDHFDRMMDHSETLRELVMASLETYLSVVNNRMNDIMKTLTLITTLFMPLSFVTGFFGMNFFQPEAHPAGWTSEAAFVATLAVMLLIPVFMFAWMRRRAWM